jgi:hypothetical protein
MNDELRARYNVAIRSCHWRELRVIVLRRRGARCERCGKQWAPGCLPKLELHHLTYERLGQEREADVILVCPTCHEKADTERAAAGCRRSAEALYWARLDGWATKVYGDDWDIDDRDDVIEAFNAWLEGD